MPFDKKKIVQCKTKPVLKNQNLISFHFLSKGIQMW